MAFSYLLNVPELGQGTRQTDGQTDTAHNFVNAPPYGGRGNNSIFAMLYIAQSVSPHEYYPQWTS